MDAFSSSTVINIESAIQIKIKNEKRKKNTKKKYVNLFDKSDLDDSKLFEIVDNYLNEFHHLN